jgi:hypothetical protein
MWISGSIPAWRRKRASSAAEVIAEDGDGLAAGDCVGEPLRRLRHGGEDVGIGHRALDRRIKERLDRIDLDIAAGKNARQQLRKFVPLRDRQRQRRAALVEPATPCASGRRALDAEEEAVRVRHVQYVVPGRAFRRELGIHVTDQNEMARSVNMDSRPAALRGDPE